MELKDIDDKRDKTPDRLDTTSQPRRGSHLLASAGIGIENRRRLSHQTAEAEGRIFQQGKEVYVQDKDGKLTRLEVVEVREKMGLLRKAVPILPLPFAVIFCVFNTILPGTGTIMGALSLLCCGKCRHERASSGIKYGFIAAALQIVTAVFIVGWIYSIVYGVNMVQDALTKGSGIQPEEKTDEGNKAAGGGDNQNGQATDAEANKPSQASQAWA